MFRKLILTALLCFASIVTSLNASTMPPLWETNYGTYLNLGDDNTTSVNLGIAFPFLGSTYTQATVSSNGFLQLGGSNGALCCSASTTTFLAGPPMIAPLWFDLVSPTAPQLNNTLPDRAVITWNTDEYCCSNPEFFQVQLLTNGTIIFGYDTLNIAGHDSLVGVTPGHNSTDPGSSNFGSLPIDTGAQPTAYDYKAAGQPFEFSSGTNIVFTPNAQGGWIISSTLAGVPEPSTMVLFGLGMVAVAIGRRQVAAR